MIKDEGMPKHIYPSEFGNLYIEFSIEMPKSLTEEQKAGNFLFPPSFPLLKTKTDQPRQRKFDNEKQPFEKCFVAHFKLCAVANSFFFFPPFLSLVALFFLGFCLQCNAQIINIGLLLLGCGI